MREVVPISVHEAENAYTLVRKKDGTESYTLRTRGPAEEMLDRARSYRPGSAGTHGVVESVSLNYDGPGMATLEVTWVSSVSSAGGGSEDSDPVVNETLDVQTMEKPLDSAPFWKGCSEGGWTGGHAQAKAMKAVQAYIDAPDESEGVAKAKEILGQDPSDGFFKFCKYRMQGIEAYWIPAPTLSKSVSGAISVPSGFGGSVCKVVKPTVSKVPIPKIGGSEGEWLCSGERITWDGVSFTHETSWIGAESWNEDFYSKAET